MAVAHYLDALDWQRDVARLHAIFGGRNPHPNFVVGGVPCPIDLNSDSAINSKRLSQVQDIISTMRSFVEQVYVPDTLAIAGFYKDWFTRGEGVGNFMTYGDFPAKGMDDPSSWLIPAGVILNRDICTIHELDLNAADQIKEYVAIPGMTTAGARTRVCIRTTGKPTSTTPAPTALQTPGRGAVLFLAQITALEGQGRRSRAAGEGADAVCQRQ